MSAFCSRSNWLCRRNLRSPEFGSLFMHWPGIVEPLFDLSGYLPKHLSCAHYLFQCQRQRQPEFCWYLVFTRHVSDSVYPNVSSPDVNAFLHCSLPRRSRSDTDPNTRGSRRGERQKYCRTIAGGRKELAFTCNAPISGGTLDSI